MKDFKSFVKPMICPRRKKCTFSDGCHGNVHEHNTACDGGYCDGDNGTERKITCRPATEADLLLEGY
jgi:hypothetical protein